MTESANQKAEYLQTQKRFLRFLLLLFVIFPVIGAITSYAYYAYVTSMFEWSATTVLYVGLVFWGIGFMAPGLIFSIRMMFHTLIITHKALEQSGDAIAQGQKMAVAVESLREKAEPILKDLAPVVKDAGTVVGKVSDLTKQLNGNLDPATLKKIATAVERGVDTIPKLREWAKEQVPKVRSSLEKHLYTMADDFLGRVLGPGKTEKEETP